MSILNDLKDVKKLSSASLATIVNVSNENFKKISQAMHAYLTNIVYDETANKMTLGEVQTKIATVNERIQLIVNSDTMFSVNAAGEVRSKTFVADDIAEARRFRLFRYDGYPLHGIPGEIVYGQRTPTENLDFWGYIQGMGWLSLTDRGGGTAGGNPWAGAVLGIYSDAPFVTSYGRYLVDWRVPAVGSFLGKEGQIAQWTTEGWEFTNVPAGSITAVENELNILYVSQTTEPRSWIHHHLGSILSTKDQEYYTASIISADHTPTGIKLTDTPVQDSQIIVTINGVKALLGNSDRFKSAYFSRDGGLTALNLKDIEKGDELIWNGAISGYDLKPNDLVAIDYIVNGDIGAGSGGTDLSSPHNYPFFVAMEDGKMMLTTYYKGQMVSVELYQRATMECSPYDFNISVVDGKIYMDHYYNGLIYSVEMTGDQPCINTNTITPLRCAPLRIVEIDNKVYITTCYDGVRLLVEVHGYKIPQSMSDLSDMPTYINNTYLTVNNDGDLEWVSLDPIPPVLTYDIIPTIKVGGVNVGDLQETGKPIENVLRDILTPYIPSGFNSLTIDSSNNGIMEANEIITINSALYTSFNDSDGNPPHDRTITGDGFNRIIDAESSPYLADSGTTSQRTTPGFLYWTISGKDKNDAAVVQATASKEWRYKWFFGASTNIPIAGMDQALFTDFVNSMQQQQLVAGKGNFVTCGPYTNTVGYYTYVIYAAVYGDLTNIIQNGALPVLTAFTKIGDANYLNSKGLVVPMRIYKSNAPRAFANGVTLTIS